jgi:hypothetical protein
MSDASDSRRNNGAGRHRKGAVAAAAAALAGGMTHTAAAKRAGVSDRTIRAWLKVPAFVARVERLRSQMVSVAVGKVSKQLALNIDRLSRIARSKDEKAAIAAMRALLEHWRTLRESGELSDQVRELLARIGGGR